MRKGKMLTFFVCMAFAWCAVASESAEPQGRRSDALGRASKSDELEGGVSLTEIVQKSADGEVTMRITRVARNGATVFESMWMRPFEPNDSPTVLRSYFCNGKLLLSEQVGGKKGGVPIIVFPDEEGGPAQAFDEKNGGILVPWDKDRMENARRQFGLTQEIMQPIVEAVKEGASKQQRGEAIEKAVERAKQGVGQQTTPEVKSRGNEGREG